MIIDFHTHIFPDELAPRAISKLTADILGRYQPRHNGTLAGLLTAMSAAGVDLSVNMPIVTKPSQTRSVNEWAAQLAERSAGRVLSFGGIYPHTDHFRSDIDMVVSLGLPGLKFHAEYQDFVLDDPQMLRIYDYALSRGLIILHHGGLDPAFPAPYRSTPQRFLNVVRALPGGVIIAAHLGGQSQWDEVERVLVGSGIYLDTAMGLELYPHDQFLRIVANHGADKILFASDSPWSDAGRENAILESLPLAPADIAAISSGNARRLLGL